MCGPVAALPAIMTATSVAGTALAIYSQAKAAKAQEAAIRSQFEQSQKEFAAKASAETNDRLREMRREQSRIKVAAGEAGLQLSGSIDMLLQDSLMQAGLTAGRIEDNREREVKNAEAEATSMMSRVDKPSVVGAGLQIGTAAMDGYVLGSSMKISRQAAQKRTGGAPPA